MKRPNIFVALLVLILAAAFSLYDASSGSPAPGLGGTLYPVKSADHLSIEDNATATITLRLQGGNKSSHSEKDDPDGSFPWAVNLTQDVFFAVLLKGGIKPANGFLPVVPAAPEDARPRAPPFFS